MTKMRIAAGLAIAAGLMGAAEFGANGSTADAQGAAAQPSCASTTPECWCSPAAQGCIMPVASWTMAGNFAR